MVGPNKVKLFKEMDLSKAYDYASEGGQALHLVEHSPSIYPNAPNCFKRATRFAHLIDNDKDRLIITVRQLGVRVIKVSREGRQGQHIDLCGRPLAKAIMQCTNSIKGPAR